MMAAVFKWLPIALLPAAVIFSGCKTIPTTAAIPSAGLSAWLIFQNLRRSENLAGETVLLSPKIPSHIPWNELIVSWNADAALGNFFEN